MQGGRHNYNVTLIATTFLLLIVHQKYTHGTVIVNMKILNEDIQCDYKIRQEKKRRVQRRHSRISMGSRDE